MKNRKRSSLLILLLLGTSLVSLFFFFESDPGPKRNIANSTQPKIKATSPEAQNLVNKHLWMTSKAQELSEAKTSYENSRMTFRVGDSIWPAGKDKERKVDSVENLSGRAESEVAQDLNRDRKEYSLNNPDNIIQGQLADQERMREYTEEYRAEYARQFIENAKRHGYDVQLNSDYVVIKVTRRPSQAQSYQYLDSRPQAK